MLLAGLLLQHASCELRNFLFHVRPFSLCRLLHRFYVLQCQRLTESNFVTLISSFPTIALFLNYSANLKILIKFVHLYAFNFLFIVVIHSSFTGPSLCFPFHYELLTLRSLN